MPAPERLLMAQRVGICSFMISGMPAAKMNVKIMVDTEHSRAVTSDSTKTSFLVLMMPIEAGTHAS